MGRRSKTRGRDVQGVLLLDKPAGVTSNGVLQHLKKMYQARKAGHTGSLDKPATGLLPICFGEATKFSGYLLDSDKAYLATCKLGGRTTTGDASGDLIEQKPVPELDNDQIEAALSRFRGEISQVPPMYSALKHQGKRLYQLAYKGQEVERRPRKVTVHVLTLLGFREDEIDIEVHSSKGTYIRTLVEDIGTALSCGAYVLALRRIAVGPLTIDKGITLEQLERLAEDGLEQLDKQLMATDSILGHLPDVNFNESLIFYLRRGQAVLVPNAPTQGLVRIYHQGRFIGLGEVLDDGRIAPKRLLRS